MFSSIRKPWRAEVHVGTQSSVAVPSVHWTLSCSASESDGPDEGGGGAAASHSATAASNCPLSFPSAERHSPQNGR